MKSIRYAGWYQIAVGACIILMWAMLLTTGQVPELATEPWSIALHLVAEF